MIALVPLPVIIELERATGFSRSFADRLMIAEDCSLFDRFRFAEEPDDRFELLRFTEPLLLLFERVRLTVPFDLELELLPRFTVPLFVGLVAGRFLTVDVLRVRFTVPRFVRFTEALSLTLADLALDRMALRLFCTVPRVRLILALPLEASPELLGP